MSTEAIPSRQANLPRLADFIADPGTQAAFAIERELGIDVEDVLHISDELQTAIELQADRSIDQRIGRQLQ